MFKVLNDPQATIADLCKSHIQIEVAQEKLDAEHDQKYAELVELQMEAMSGENVAARIKKRQAELTDIESKNDACEKGLSAIKERIAFSLPDETRQKIESLRKTFEPLQAEESGLYKKFFSKCAEAIAIRERIKGIEMTYFHHSGDMRESAPELIVKAHSGLMNTEDTVFLREEIKESRKDNDGFIPVKERIDAIRNKIHKANRLLDSCEDGVTPEIVEKVIKEYRIQGRR